MTAPTPNTELAYRVLDHIDAHPDQWDQARWWAASPHCGTAGCFAGWAVQLSGGRMERDDFAYIVVKSGLGELDGTYVPVAAASLLGLPMEEPSSEGEAENLPLFHESNTRDDLGRLVAEIFGPRPAPAAEPIGLVEGDTAAEQYDNAAARYEADEYDVPPNAGSSS